MKRVLVATLALLSACDWQAAENKARCTAGEQAFCDGGTLGGGTGGGGGGTAEDAGRVEYLVNGVSPFALHPGVDGLVWVITASSDKTFVSQLRGDELTFLGPFDGGPAASHADPAVGPTLLVATVDGAAGTGFPDGGLGGQLQLPAPLRASTVSQYRDLDGGLMASIWTDATTEYAQYLSPSPGLTPLAKIMEGPSSCTGLIFHDFASVPVSSTCCGVVGYSGSCTGLLGVGIDGGSGFQVIALDNTRSGVRLEGATTRVMLGSSARGFDVATKPASNLILRRYDTAFTETARYTVSATAGLTLGDVSDGFVTFHAAGNFRVEDGGVVDVAMLTAVVAEPATGRVVTLGMSQGTPPLPVLVQQDRVLVLWRRSDGQLVLTQLSR